MANREIVLGAVGVRNEKWLEKRNNMVTSSASKSAFNLIEEKTIFTFNDHHFPSKYLEHGKMMEELILSKYKHICPNCHISH